MRIAIARARLPPRPRGSLVLRLQRREEREIVQPMLVRRAKGFETGAMLGGHLEHPHLPGNQAFEIDGTVREIRRALECGGIQPALFHQTIQTDEQGIARPR